MTLIICVKTYKKFGLVAKNCVGTLVCLIYIQNVKRKTRKLLSPCRKYAVQTKYIVSELIQLSNVYINVKRPPKKYITFYEEVVINLG